MENFHNNGVIHIVDDEKDIVSLAASALQREGYAVHSFTSPSEALKDIELVCKKKVKMLITDIRMPEHRGFEVAKRTRLIVPEIPVILMTAFEINSSEFETMFPSFKVNAFLQKPFGVDKLLQVVKANSK